MPEVSGYRHDIEPFGEPRSVANRFDVAVGRHRGLNGDIHGGEVVFDRVRLERGCLKLDGLGADSANERREKQRDGDE